MTQEIKTNIISLIFAIGCLVLYFFFPIDAYKFEILVGAVSFLVVLPLLYVQIILHKKTDSVGFTSMRLGTVDFFYIISAIVIGGLIGFVMVSLQWGIQNYLLVLSPTILQNFGAFALYELVFSSLALFLITFFSWGFIYAIKWHNPVYTFLSAFVIYAFLITDFYNSAWMAIPFLVPACFVQKIRDEKNIIYFFLIVFSIGLIIDTLIVKSFS